MIRTATPDDLPRLAELEALLFGADAWSAESVRAEIDGDRRTFLVRVLEGEVVGYVVTLASGDVVDLTRIGIEPRLQREGYATHLLAEALEHVGDAERMMLEVSVENVPATKFYARHGFFPIDVRRHYYRDGSDAVVMMRPLVVPEAREEASTRGRRASGLGH